MESTVFFTLVKIFISVETLLPGGVGSTEFVCFRWKPGARADGPSVGAATMPLPASSSCSLAAGFGRTVVGAGVTVVGVAADSVEGTVEAGDTLAGALADASADALAEALADALAEAVAEDDAACAIRDALFSFPLRAALALLSLPASLAGISICLSGWYSASPPSV